jgi:aminocarboxymuconate-semialdehyde decarboxylase
MTSSPSLDTPSAAARDEHESSRMLAVDMHAHYWPRGLLEAARTGETWYGWKAYQEIGGRTVIAQGTRIAPFQPPQADLAEAGERIKTRIDSQGVAFEAPMPVGFLWNYNLQGSQARGYSRELNEELAELQSQRPGHYRALGSLPLQDTQAAIDEVEFAVKELGITSFAVATGVNGKNLDDPTVLPVLEAVAEAGATLSVHPIYMDKIGENRMPRYGLARSFGALFESCIAVASIVFCGILDKYPDFRISFSHGGGVFNFAAGRLDLRYASGGIHAPMKLPPSDYLQLFYYDCLVHDEDVLKLLAARAGHDRIMIGTDYPFDGDIPGGAANWIRNADWLTEDQKQDILWRNAARFLGLGEGFTPSASVGGES